MLSVISYPVFVLSVVLALVLSISLFPVGWFEFRPEWLGLVVFYWTFRAPAQFGVLLAWCLGLLLQPSTLTATQTGGSLLALVLYWVFLPMFQRRFLPQRGTTC